MKTPDYSFYANPDGVTVLCCLCPWVAAAWIEYPDEPELAVFGMETLVQQHLHIEHQQDKLSPMRQRFMEYRKQGLTDEQLRDKFYGRRTGR